MKEKVYTMADWERDKTLSPAIGQEVSREVFNEQLNCVPPAYYSNGIMQVGEPYGTIGERGTTQDIVYMARPRTAKRFLISQVWQGLTELPYSNQLKHVQYGEDLQELQCSP